MNHEELSPRIRKLVKWLNKNGFETTDSGDGSNFKNGMGCAVSYPMVSIWPGDKDLRREADRLYTELLQLGVNFGRPVNYPKDVPQIQASYDPHDGISNILLLYVTDEIFDFKP